jgi:broad specificity phosphatase PhoE
MLVLFSEILLHTFAIHEKDMSIIYFIRHAQAGTRDNYDVLSDLGQRQAKLLGEYFAGQGLRFSTVIAGGMQRQQHTAQLVCAALADAEQSKAEIVVDERWNEFTLRAVYEGISARMIAESPEFARDFAEMQELLKRDPHAVRGAAGRCDAAIIRAWMSNRYPDYEGESWQAFKSRIVSRVQEIPDDGNDQIIAVFTSATPVAITTSHALELSDEKLLSILGVIANSSVTVTQKNGDDLRLFSFNATPHLDDSNRTYR